MRVEKVLARLTGYLSGIDRAPEGVGEDICLVEGKLVIRRVRKVKRDTRALYSPKG